jgi:uncharacterized membrane protein
MKSALALLQEVGSLSLLVSFVVSLSALLFVAAINLCTRISALPFSKLALAPLG